MGQAYRLGRCRKAKELIIEAMERAKAAKA